MKIECRRSLVRWFRNVFNLSSDNGSGVVALYLAESHNHIKSGTSRSVDYSFAHGDNREFKRVFWWFVNFVNSCREAPNDLITTIARDGRPYGGHDRQLMLEWAIAMRDPESLIMRSFRDLTHEEIETELAPFMVAAKVMVRMELVGPNG